MTLRHAAAFLLAATFSTGATASENLWLRHPAPIEADLHRVFFHDEDAGWILTYGDGTVLSTRDGGKTWQVQARFEANYLERVLFVDRTHGWVTGDYGRVYKTVDGGETWHDVSPPVEGLLTKPADGTSYRDDERPGLYLSYYAARFVDARQGRVWGTGFRTENPRETRVLRFFSTADAGESWTELDSWPKIPFADKWRERPQGGGSPTFYLDARHGWKVGRGGKVERSIDGGETWVTSEIPDRGVWMWRDLVFLDADHGFAFGDADREAGTGVIYETNDGGATWRRIELEIPAPHAVASTPSRIWVVGKRGLLLSRAR